MLFVNPAIFGYEKECILILRKVVETQVITNFYVMQNTRSIPLNDIDDIVIMNQHRESQYQGNRYHFRGSGMSYGNVPPLLNSLSY